MSPIAQARKDALIANLAEARKNILNAASALPAKQRDEIFLGSWSVKDLLAHLIGWDYTNIQAVEAILTEYHRKGTNDHADEVLVGHTISCLRMYSIRLR